MKKHLLFVISQFYKGGAEVALLNIFECIPKDQYEIDFLIFDQIPLPNAKSLIPQIPEWIHVCNASEKEGKFAVLFKVASKIALKVANKQIYRTTAKKFVKGKKYDYAFSYGEWISPEFIAKQVDAKKKAVWIHTDIDKAKYINPKILFGYDKCYDNYIFVSKESLNSAVKKYPVAQTKSVIIHNLCDEENIKKLSKMNISEDISNDIPVLLSVGNLRDEKNYPRQVEVMKLIKDRGIAVKWYVIGSTANPLVYNKVKSLIKQYGLEDDFVLLGVDDNPYKYMSKVDAVTVLSDYESWSMVITEAKILGVPVIATRTSGAIEQITDKVNGLLTGFSSEEIADKIQMFLEDREIQKQIRDGLLAFHHRDMIKGEIEEYLEVDNHE